jgi:hypothetical protein
MLFIPSRRIWWNSICLDIRQTCISLLYVWRSEMLQKQKAPPYRHLDCQFISQSACKFFLFFSSFLYTDVLLPFLPVFIFASRESSGVWDCTTNGSGIRSQDLVYRAVVLRQNDYFNRLVQQLATFIDIHFCVVWYFPVIISV